MAKKLLIRLAEYICILFAVSALIFFMIHLFSPTDPISVIVGGKGSTSEMIENARRKFYLDQPVWRQYLIWLGGIFRGDWGVSYKYQTPVLDSILSRAPVTLGLVIGSFLLSIGAAIPLGVLSAVKKDRISDRLISVLSLTLAAVPPFLLSILMVFALAKTFPQYPITGGYQGVKGYLWRMLAPCIALACAKITITLKVTRQGMVEQMKRPYMMNIQAKGMPESNRIWKHGLKNAVIPVISILSIQIGAMIVGAVLVESVFSLSGIGSLLIDSIKSSDYPVVQAIILMLVLVFLLAGWAADVLYEIIDPRIRARKGK